MHWQLKLGSPQDQRDEVERVINQVSWFFKWFFCSRSAEKVREKIEQLEEELSNPRFSHDEFWQNMDEHAQNFNEVKLAAMGIIFLLCGFIRKRKLLLLRTSHTQRPTTSHPRDPGWAHRKIRNKWFDSETQSNGICISLKKINYKFVFYIVSLCAWESSPSPPALPSHRARGSAAPLLPLPSLRAWESADAYPTLPLSVLEIPGKLITIFLDLYQHFHLLQ